MAAGPENEATTATLMVSPVGIIGLLGSKSDMSAILSGSKLVIAAVARGNPTRLRQQTIIIGKNNFLNGFIFPSFAVKD